MAKQINVAVGADVSKLKEGLKVAVSTMEAAGKDMSGVAQSVSSLTEGKFRNLQQAYRTTAKDAQVLAANLGKDSQAFQEAARMAAYYKDELDDVNDAIKAASPEQRWKLVGSAMSATIDIAQGMVGVMSLIGVESQRAEEAIKSMMALGAISQAITAVFTLSDAYKALTANIAATTLASNTLWASMLKPLTMAAGVMAAIGLLPGEAGKGSSLFEGFNFDTKKLDFGEKAKTPEKAIKKEVESLTTNENVFGTLQIALRGLDVSSKTEQLKEMNAQLAEIGKAGEYYIEPTGQSLNKMGVIFDELGNAMGGWASVAAGAMGDFAYSLGSALTGATNFSDDLMSILGGLAGQAGDAMLMIGAAMSIAPGAQGIAWGWLAAGAALKFASGVLGGLSSGGGSTMGSGASAAQANYSGSFNFAPSSAYIGVSGLVRGDNLVIAVDNTNRRNRRVK